MRACLVLAIFALAFGRTTPAQMCPAETPSGPSQKSIPRDLSGTLIYHNEYRQWFGLKLDAPVCGESEIQVVQLDDSHVQPLEIYRGCKVTVQGPLEIPGTTYFSAALFQDVTQVTPAAGCVLKQPFPDYSKLKPPHSVRSYTVSMRLLYGEGGGPIRVSVHAGNRPLSPWQIYANYYINGSFSVYAPCADGFTLKTFRGTPAAKPWQLDNQVLFDPESAAAKGIHRISLDYTCRR